MRLQKKRKNIFRMVTSSLINTRDQDRLVGDLQGRDFEFSSLGGKAFESPGRRQLFKFSLMY